MISLIATGMPYIEAFHYAPIVATLLCAGVLRWSVLSNPQEEGVSISKHISSSRRHFIAAGLVFTACGIFLSGFTAYWLGPTYHLSTVVYGFSALFLLASQLVAWNMADVIGSRKLAHKLHNLGMFFSVIYSVGICLLAIFSNEIRELSPISHAFAIFCLIVYAFTLLIYLSHRLSRQYFVFYESIAVGCFFAVFVLLSMGI